MKILITTDNIGGVWTYTLNLVRGLKKNGIEAYVAVIGDEMTDYQKKELEFVPWSFIRSRQEWMQDPWHDMNKAGEWLLDLKDDIRPDIIHLNSFSLGSLPWRLPIIVTAHSCVLSWFEAVRNHKAPDEWEIYRNFVTQGLREADAVTAPSYTMLKAINKFYGPVKNKMVIYNGADASMYHSGKKEDLIFCMGRIWDDAKNIMLILQAANSIRYPVFIAGDANGFNTGKLPNNIHILGKISSSEVSSWLSKAAVYLLPVRYEPFGYTFLEAAFSSCAIVTGNIGSMKEIWHNDVTYVDTRDRDGLARTVNRLIENHDERQMIAERAFNRAKSDYTLERMVDGYILLYHKLSGIKKKLKLQEL
jgi:glycosyltransferase involved in cell wall biosynthesis